MGRSEAIAGALLLALGSSVARAEEAPASPMKLGGYVETYGAWNFNRPSNGITNLRGFDHRHASFTISNAVVDLQWEQDRVIGRAVLQVGSAPASYMLAEPARAGTGSVAATGAELWRYVQQAIVGYRFGAERQVAVTAGLFLSPIGPESMAIKDAWHWSRSNLFVGLPFYHTGVRVAFTPSDAWTYTLHVCNGWNSVVDANEAKSVSVEALWQKDGRRAQLLYFGGVERPDGAPEGQPWRHLVDAFVEWRLGADLSALAQVDAGIERTRFGDDAWLAGAVAARYRIVDTLYVAARADAFREDVPANDQGRASPIFWPAAWVGSFTTTLDYRPAERASFRLEFRHDRAASDAFFGGDVAGDGVAVPYVPNRSSQTTVTLGATTWL